MKELIDQLASANYDFIIIDTPPFVNIVDPVILGKLSDGMILIVLHNKTNRKGINNSLDKMKEFSIKNLGIVLNNMSLKSEYHSYAYAYKVSEDELEEEKNRNEKIKKNKEKKTSKKKAVINDSKVKEIKKKSTKKVKKAKRLESKKVKKTKNEDLQKETDSNTSYSYSYVEPDGEK